jgi:hypothetical protein
MAFNRSLWRATGQQIGREARAMMNQGFGYSTFWAPVINLARCALLAGCCCSCCCCSSSCCCCQDTHSQPQGAALGAQPRDSGKLSLHGRYCHLTAPSYMLYGELLTKQLY